MTPLSTPSTRPLSAVFIAQNEADCIERSVAACHAFADEVLVVDGGSTDATPRLAEAAGARVVRNDWPGYAKQRNFAAAQAAHDWVLFVDADEVPGQALARALEAWKRRPGVEPHQAFAVHRMNNFYDDWIGQGEWQVRLYNRTQTSVRDVPVHETPDVDPADVHRLDGTLWHFGFRSVENLVGRFNHYTTLEAEKAYAAGRRFNPARLLARPPARFVHRYVVQGRWKTGMSGLTSAVLWVFYEALAELKLYELHWRARRADRAAEPDLLP